MKRQIFVYSLFFAALFTTGCKKILEEQPRTFFAPSFFSTADGVQGGIAGIYSSFRGHWGTQIWLQQYNSGTDETLRGGAAHKQHWFTYNNATIKSTTADYQGFWNTLFIDINTANGVLQYGADANLPAATKTQIFAQAKFLRGFCYYYLVTTFGQVPLHTTFNSSASQPMHRHPWRFVCTDNERFYRGGC